ncbi:leucine-rich repeat domain-containing protein [Bacteroides heparinolyticus]|uniref:leucine-rich repeat domain-containing protein n=1 Tax=Prevotella heparinolytica TaxID=28113 RepID=UPI0035A11026
MRQTRLLFSLLLAIIMSATGAFAQTVGTTFDYQDCTYKVVKKDLHNTSLNEVQVLKVGGSSKVVIPTKVQTPVGMDLEWYNVVGCVPWESKVDNGVTEVEFSEGFKEINSHSFRSAENLQKIIIPATCEQIGIGCFLNCQKLTEFVVKSGNTKYKADGGSLLSRDGKQLVYVPAGKTGDYTVPNGVEEIMPSAFSNCREMKKITIPASVSKISENAEYPSFSSSGTHFTVVLGNAKYKDINGLLCSNDGKTLVHVPFKYDQLQTPDEKLTIPAGVTTVAQNAAVNCYMKQLDLNETQEIGNSAFNSCSALESVKIGKDVTKIGKGAFTNCPKIKAFDVAEENTHYKSKDGVIFTEDDKVLLIYPSGKEGVYTVPEGTEKIEESAFADVQKLEEITIAKTVKTIGQAAFKTAKVLKKVNFTTPSQLEEIGANAFQNAKLETLTIPATVKKLGDASFADIKTLTEVHIANGSLLEILPPFLFSNAEKLTKVVFDGTNNLKTIQSSVFSNCASLQTFTIPKTVDRIASNAFKGAQALETVLFEEPSVLTSIGNGAFADCGITHIKLPESIKLIDELAFDHCTKLTEIELPKNLLEVKKGAFNFCESLLRFRVASGNTKYSTLDGMLCDIKKEELHVFPAGKADSKYTLVPYFKKVAAYCFYGSNKVTNITFPKTVTEIGTHAIALCNNLKSLSFMGEENVPELKADIMYQSGNLRDVTIFVRKKWYENSTNDATVNTYNSRFKEVHPSFVTEVGYDRGTEFFPTSMSNVGVISFYNERTSVVIKETAKEPNYTDTRGKTWQEKDYMVSSILDFAYEKTNKVEAIVSLADMGYVGMNSFKGNSIKDVYFVGNTPGSLGSVDYEQPDSYPFKENQNIYVKQSKVQAYKEKWEVAKTIGGTEKHTLNITHKIPQTTNSYGGTVCFPFDVKYPSGQGSNDIKPYVPKDYTHAYDTSNPFVKAYSVDNYYVPAFVGALIRSKETVTVNSYCEMDEAQAHDKSALTALGYSETDNNRMIGAVEDTPITNETGYQYYAFSKSRGKFVQLKNGATFPYFKAYFRMANSASAPAKGFCIVFDDDSTVTGIDGIIETGKDSDNAPYYNLSGVQVKPTKGVYIHNGKKVIIK